VNIVFKGLPVHYEILGEGLPLIFLHGFNENSHVWDLIIPTISKQYKTIIIDLPGFGKSPLPSPLSLHYMANAVHRIIEELNLVKPIIVGHSMGGYVCLELAQHYPNLMSGSALFQSTAIADTSEKKENRIKTLDFLHKNPVESFYKVFIPSLFAPQNLKSDLLNFTQNIINQTAKESVIAGTGAMLQRTNKSDVLINSSIPWLFVAGKYDQLIPTEQMALQASYCSRAMFEILFNSGHMGMLEESEKSSEIILKFANWVHIQKLINKN